MTAPEPMAAAGARLSIWREAPSLEGRRTAALGAFACESPKAGAALLRDACERLAAEGFGAILGPMDGDTWASHRLVVDSDGRPPFFLEPRNPDFYPAAFDRAGLEVVARYQSAERPTGPVEARDPPAGVVIRPFDVADADAELARMHALSLEAFARNAFYRPLGADRFLAAYRPAVAIIDPELVLMAEDDAGRLRGFLFAVPDMEQGARPSTMILKTYASRVRGLGGALADRFHATACAKGYATVVHALMHEDNVSAERSADLNARVFRRYALWGRRL